MEMAVQLPGAIGASVQATHSATMWVWSNEPQLSARKRQTGGKSPRTSWLPVWPKTGVRETSPATTSRNSSVAPLSGTRPPSIASLSSRAWWTTARSSSSLTTTSYGRPCAHCRPTSAPFDRWPTRHWPGPHSPRPTPDLATFGCSPASPARSLSYSKPSPAIIRYPMGTNELHSCAPSSSPTSTDTGGVLVYRLNRGIRTLCLGAWFAGEGHGEWRDCRFW